MRKKTKRNLKIAYLMLLLVLTILMLSSTSYAWFTANRIVTVNTINVHVAASGGVEISADGTTWKAIIMPEDITGVHSTTYPTSVNQIPYQLEPVSTAKDIDTANGYLKMYYGVTDNNDEGDYILTSTRSIEREGNGLDSDGKFIVFDLFFKTSSETTLYLTNESKVTYTDPEREKGIANAARIAFVDEGTVPVGTDLRTIQGLKNASRDRTYIWEPNYDVHTNAAIANARDTYGITTTQTGAQRINYDGVATDISHSDLILLKDANSRRYPGKFKPITIDYPTRKNFTDYVQAFSLNGGITKMRVYMWIEGQDVDCENNASFDDIQYDLQLTVNPA